MGPATVTGASYPSRPEISPVKNQFYSSSLQLAYLNTTITIHRMVTKDSDLLNVNNDSNIIDNNLTIPINRSININIS
jgi:hypothetical protein